MILTNIGTVPGKTIVEHYGLVQSSTVRAKHLGRDIMAGLKNIVGGELRGYTELLQESRNEALSRMTAQAEELGANAIINVRLATASVTAGRLRYYAMGRRCVWNKIGAIIVASALFLSSATGAAKFRRLTAPV